MLERLSAAWGAISTNPVFWLFLTLAVFVAGQKLYGLAKRNPLCSPIIVAVVSLILFLQATNVSYDVYFEGAGFIHFLLGPATVALAVPLFEQRARLARLWVPLAIGLTAGCVVAIVSVILLGWLFGLSHETLVSMVPKSVTTPIAMGVSESLGGQPDLTAAFVVITGIFGSIVGRPLFELVRIRSEAVRGVSLGLAAHGMGTSAAFMIGNRAGAFSGLAMGLSGIITAFLAPVLALPLIEWIGL